MARIEQWHPGMRWWWWMRMHSHNATRCWTMTHNVRRRSQHLFAQVEHFRKRSTERIVSQNFFWNSNNLATKITISLWIEKRTMAHGLRAHLTESQLFCDAIRQKFVLIQYFTIISDFCNKYYVSVFGYFYTKLFIFQRFFLNVFRQV